MGIFLISLFISKTELATKNIVADVPTSVEETEVMTYIEETTTEIETTTQQKTTTVTQPYRTGYINGNNICVRKRPSKRAKSKEKVFYGKRIRYKKINAKWAKIKAKNVKGYIQIKYISKKVKKGIIHNTIPNYKLHSYMSYKSLSSTTSKQYKLQKIAYTGRYGIRQVDGRFCIAMGSYYTTKIGTYIDLELSDGTVIPCVLADCKADIHTDSMNQKTSDGSLIEFIVDTNYVSNQVRLMGDVSYANDGWQNKVTKIKIYKKVEKY